MRLSYEGLFILPTPVECKYGPSYICLRVCRQVNPKGIETKGVTKYGAHNNSEHPSGAMIRIRKVAGGLEKWVGLGCTV